MNNLAGYGEEVPEDDEAFDQTTFDSGVDKRVPVIMLLDTSSSMSPEDGPVPKPIDELNSALVSWAEELHGDSRLRHRAEVAIITFGAGGVEVLNESAPFVPAAIFEAPTLTAAGVTPMLLAIEQAIDLSERRKRELDELGISRFRTLVFMITDGAPTDSDGHVLDEPAWRPMANELARLEASNKLAFFAVGVKGASIDTLKGLAPDGYWNLGQGDFTEFLRLVSASAGQSDPLAAARENLIRLHARG